MVTPSFGLLVLVSRVHSFGRDFHLVYIILKSGWNMNDFTFGIKINVLHNIPVHESALINAIFPLLLDI